MTPIDVIIPAVSLLVPSLEEVLLDLFGEFDDSLRGFVDEHLMDCHGGKHGFHQCRLSCFVHKTYLPRWELNHAIDEWHQLHGGGTPNRQRDPQVGDREIMNGQPRLAETTAASSGVQLSSAMELFVLFTASPDEWP